VKQLLQNHKTDELKLEGVPAPAVESVYRGGRRGKSEWPGFRGTDISPPRSQRLQRKICSCFTRSKEAVLRVLSASAGEKHLPVFTGCSSFAGENRREIWRKDAKACLFSGFVRQAAKESGERGKRTRRKGITWRPWCLGERRSMWFSRGVAD